MTQSTITIIIILCTCALYLTEKLPVALVTAWVAIVVQYRLIF